MDNYELICITKRHSNCISPKLREFFPVASMTVILCQKEQLLSDRLHLGSLQVTSRDQDIVDPYGADSFLMFESEPFGAIIDRIENCFVVYANGCKNF